MNRTEVLRALVRDPEQVKRLVQLGIDRGWIRAAKSMVKLLNTSDRTAYNREWKRRKRATLLACGLTTEGNPRKRTWCRTNIKAPVGSAEYQRIYRRERIAT